MRPLLSITFPQGFRISKNIGHPISGSGGKKTFKRNLKSKQTDRHKKTNILTYRKQRRLKKWFLDLHQIKVIHFHHYLMLYSKKKQYLTISAIRLMCHERITILMFMIYEKN